MAKSDWLGGIVTVCTFCVLIGVALMTPTQETQIALDQTIPQLLIGMDIPLYNAELTNHMQAFAARAIASPEGSFVDNDEFVKFVADNPLTAQVFYYDISESSQGYPKQELTRVYWIMGSSGIPYVKETYEPTAAANPYLGRSWEVADITSETVIFKETHCCGFFYVFGSFVCAAIIGLLVAWRFEAKSKKRSGCIS